jgi:hypothetical protein
MKAITILAIALAFAPLVGCGNKDKSSTTETTTAETSSSEDKPGFLDRFRGDDPIVVVKHEEDEPSWRWFGWFRGDAAPEPIVEVTVPSEWRWFGWFRGDDEEVIVEETTEERSWFTKR